MRYMLLIYADESAAPTEGQREACYKESSALGSELAAAGKFLASAPLHPTPSATSVRIRDGKRLVTDGPFAETREQLGGYYLIDVQDLDEAIAVAARIPGARWGTVEVRPVIDLSGAPKLDPPRFEDGNAMRIAGLRGHFSLATWEGIPAQWQRLMSYGDIPGSIGSVHYGLCFNLPDGIDYLSGIQVSSSAQLPSDFSVCQIPEQRYAVFTHRGHVSELYNTMEAIQRTWAPEHQLIPSRGGAPDFFESYSQEFDPTSGTGGMEIWIPVVK